MAEGKTKEAVNSVVTINPDTGEQAVLVSLLVLMRHVASLYNTLTNVVPHFCPPAQIRIYIVFPPHFGNTFIAPLFLGYFMLV